MAFIVDRGCGAPGERLSELDPVRGARLLRAMGSATRVQGMVAMGDGAPVSARELAAEMHDPGLGLASLVFHLRELADAGALVRADPTPSSAADCRYRRSERGRWGLAIAGLEPPRE